LKLIFKQEVSGRWRELCKDPAIDVVYIATRTVPRRAGPPRRLARQALLVEKPMALTLEDCRSMIDAPARRACAGRRPQPQLRPADSANQKDHRAGPGGQSTHDHRVQLHGLPVRPRRPEELATERGGGVCSTRAAHHVDIVRLLGAAA